MYHRLFYSTLLLLVVVGMSFLTLAAPPQQDAQPTPMVAPIVPQVIPPETPVRRLRLTNPTASGDNEFSGLAWYDDTLVMLPQFPDNFLYIIEKATILESASSHDYQPGTIPFRLNGDLNVPGFQGYEAIAFYENTIYLTLESGNDGRMHSHLISGIVSENGIELDVDTLVEIPQPVNIGNKADESIIMVGNQPMTLYEWNSDPNLQPVAHLYSPEDGTFTEITLPQIPYRITDATTMDDEGRFWVINFKSSTDGERHDTGLFEQLNYRGSHSEHDYIERLLELQLVDDEIILSDDTPLYLELENEARHWEGIVRLDNRGFLLITDSYPGTVLGFVRFQPQ